jgi:hypothetical protein
MHHADCDRNSHPASRLKQRDRRSDLRLNLPGANSDGTHSQAVPALQSRRPSDDLPETWLGGNGMDYHE